jgi:hypothetical protein
MRSLFLVLAALVAAPFSARLGFDASAPDWHDTTAGWHAAVMNAMPPLARFALLEFFAVLMAFAVVVLAARPFLPYLAIVDENGVKSWGIFGYREKLWTDFIRIWTTGQRNAPTVMLSAHESRWRWFSGNAIVQIPVGKTSDSSLAEVLKVVRFYRPDLVAEMLKTARKPAKFGITLG